MRPRAHLSPPDGYDSQARHTTLEIQKRKINFNWYSQGTPLWHSEAELSLEDRVESKQSNRGTKEHLCTCLEQECYLGQSTKEALEGKE